MRFSRRRRARRPTKGVAAMPAATGKCIACGSMLAPVLTRLGSLLCHDCRDDREVPAARLLQNADSQHLARP
jgi:hypothetical protein